MSRLIILVGLLLLPGLAGCKDVPSQMYWSPDGKLAAYVAPEEEDGAIVRDYGKLKKTYGGCAWPDDSKRLSMRSAAVMMLGLADKSVKEGEYGEWLRDHCARRVILFSLEPWCQEMAKNVDTHA